MDWAAAVIVEACLVALVAWTAQRWGGPRVYVDARSPLTWAVAGVIVAALVAVNLLD